MVPRAPLHSSRRARLGGGIAELIPDELVNSGAGRGMELEKLGPRKWRFHGTPTDNWLVAEASIHLEPGTYLFSGTASDPGGQNGGLIQIFRQAGSYVQITPVDKSPKTFEVAEAEDVIFELLGRLAGNPIDLTASASLIRIGDAGGGIVNLVGRAPVTAYTYDKDDYIEVTAEGIRYKVRDSWGANFILLDVGVGAYRMDRPVAISDANPDESWKPNNYYTEMVGVDMYVHNVNNTAFSLPDGAKLGFSLPQGEGVIHPSIVRVL